MATVTMEGGAVLAEQEAREVIQTAGFKVVSFRQGEAQKLKAYLFRVNELEPAGRASLEDGLREDLEGEDRVAVDSLGNAAVVVPKDAAVTEEAISASLRKRGRAPEGLETRTWPKLDATYEVKVPGLNDIVGARTVADALAGVPKVVAVHVYQETRTATLWLKEPCSALEANVKAALASAGFTVSKLELK